MLLIYGLKTLKRNKIMTEDNWFYDMDFEDFDEQECEE